MRCHEKIKSLRNQHQLSQERLAKKLFVSRQAIAKWESGQAMPDHQNLKALSHLFGVTTDFLLDDNQNTFEQQPYQVSFKVVWVLTIFLVVLTITHGVLTAILNLSMVSFFIVPGLIFICTVPIILLFYYAIKNDDFTMIAGYNDKKRYNIIVLKKSLMTILILVLVTSLMVLVLYGLNYIIEELQESRFNLLLLGMFTVQLFIVIIFVNIKNRHKLYLD